MSRNVTLVLAVAPLTLFAGQSFSGNYRFTVNGGIGSQDAPGPQVTFNDVAPGDYVASAFGLDSAGNPMKDAAGVDLPAQEASFTVPPVEGDTWPAPSSLTVQLS